MKLKDVKMGEVFELWGETWKCVMFNYAPQEGMTTRRYQSLGDGHILELKGKVPDVEVFKPLEQEIKTLLEWQSTTLLHKGVTILASWRWGDGALVEYRIDDWAADDENIDFWIYDQDVEKKILKMLYTSKLSDAHQEQIDNIITKYGPQEVDEVLKKCITT